METKQKERIRRLMELLKKTDRIHLKEAARMLEVSVMTIRRDLSQDDEPLPLTLLGGYIVMVNKPAAIVNAPLPAQKQYHRDDLPVAILAAGLVSENDLVFFDNGAEMPLVVSMIPDDISFTGICYSHRVFVALNEKPNATAILCGGPTGRKVTPFTTPAIPPRWMHSTHGKSLSPPAESMSISALAGSIRTIWPQNAKRWNADYAKFC